MGVLYQDTGQRSGVKGGDHPKREDQDVQLHARRRGEPTKGLVFRNILCRPSHNLTRTRDYEYGRTSGGEVDANQ